MVKERSRKKQGCRGGEMAPTQERRAPPSSLGDIARDSGKKNSHGGVMMALVTDHRHHAGHPHGQDVFKDPTAHHEVTKCEGGALDCAGTNHSGPESQTTNDNEAEHSCLFRSEETLTKEFLDEIVGPEEDTECGGCGVRGGALQRLAHPVTYLLVSSVVALVQGMFYTYANATLSTVEKRFGLPSRVSGFVTTGNDIIQLVLALHIAYLAGRGHRPRWLALGMLGAVLGCLLAASPHLIFGSGDLQVEVDDPGMHPEDDLASKYGVCGGEVSNKTCGEEEGSRIRGAEQSTVVALLLVSQMLAGVASLLYYTIGYTYLDEAVSKEKVPIFLAISGSMRLVGPVCGYSLAGWCLSLWVDPALSPAIRPSHPNWVGAWWIGYLVIGSCLLVIAWSLLLLPRSLPGARRRVLDELQAAAQQGGRQGVLTLAATLRPSHKSGRMCSDMLASLRRLLTNKVFVLVCVNQVIFWFAFFGYITFKSKFLEHQFKMSAAKANQYIAGAALAATLAGWLVTGAGLTVLRPRAKWVLVFMVVLSATNCLLHFAMVNISCERDVIHGTGLVLQDSLTAPLPANTSLVGEDGGDYQVCAQSCHCSAKYSPVCVGGRDYYSACHAGCSVVSKLNGSKVYSNCTCAYEHTKGEEVFLRGMNDYTSTTAGPEEGAGDGHEGWVGKDGYCRHDCPAFYMYLALTVLTKMTHAASRVPVNIMLFRCVEERDKDLGLGVFNALIALGASIPAPIIFGWAIDRACRLWQERCEARGFCWLYDVDSFRHILHGIPAVLMAGCLATELLLLLFHDSIHLYGSDQETVSRGPCALVSASTTTTTIAHQANDTDEETSEAMAETERC